jgi:hypothetical protein
MKFSIRDVLWLTVVVALAVCWTLDRVSLRRSELRARQEAERALYMSELARAQAEMGRANEEMARAAQLLSAAP